MKEAGGISKLVPLYPYFYLLQIQGTARRLTLGKIFLLVRIPFFRKCLLTWHLIVKHLVHHWGGDLKEAGGISKLVPLYPYFYLLQIQGTARRLTLGKIFLLVRIPFFRKCLLTWHLIVKHLVHHWGDDLKEAGGISKLVPLHPYFYLLQIQGTARRLTLGKIFLLVRIPFFRKCLLTWHLIVKHLVHHWGGDLKEAGGISKLVPLYPYFYLLQIQGTARRLTLGKIFLLVRIPFFRKCLLTWHLIVKHLVHHWGGDLKEAGGISKLVPLYPYFYLLQIQGTARRLTLGKIFLLVRIPFFRKCLLTWHLIVKHLVHHWGDDLKEAGGISKLVPLYPYFYLLQIQGTARRLTLGKIFLLVRIPFFRKCLLTWHLIVKHLVHHWGDDLKEAGGISKLVPLYPYFYLLQIQGTARRLTLGKIFLLVRIPFFRKCLLMFPNTMGRVYIGQQSVSFIVSNPPDARP